MGRELDYRSKLSDYEREAEELLGAIQSGDDAALWRFKWEHPRFRGRPVRDVKAADLDLVDAETVIARKHGFEDWDALSTFTEAVHRDDAVGRFEAAVEAVIGGDAAALRMMLGAHPQLVRARSTRRHHATLLHYIAANGVESYRQKTPPNAVEIARILLDAGAEPDALADMYDEQCTTMSMLVSSSWPAEAGLQLALAETLLEYGAALDGAGSKWQSAVLTALAFGFGETAEALAGRAGPPSDLPTAAGLGRIDVVRRLLPSADAQSRHIAVALAAQHGRVEIVRLLLEAGEDPSRYNPDGFHSHATPLHQAVWSGHAETVRLLVERGARLDLRDTIHDATPLEWAEYGEKTAIAEYLRDRGAPAS